MVRKDRIQQREEALSRLHEAEQNLAIMKHIKGKDSDHFRRAKRTRDMAERLFNAVAEVP